MPTLPLLALAAVASLASATLGAWWTARVLRAHADDAHAGDAADDRTLDALLRAVSRTVDLHTLTPRPVAPLTAATVTHALAALGVADPDDPHQVLFLTPIVRIGPGWAVLLDLPAEVAMLVASQPDRLARALGRPPGSISLTTTPTTPGLLGLWAADPPNAPPAAPTPTAATKPRQRPA
jgi:hypothetical protein